MKSALLALTLLARAVNGATAEAPLSPAALHDAYAGLRSLGADVVQLKEGRYWARPLESRIRLRFTPGRVTWETLAPVPSRVIITDEGMTVTGPDGRAQDTSAFASDPRFGAILRFLRALLAIDLPALERDFELTYGPRSLEARPRPGGEVQLFRSIKLAFDDRLALTTLELETASERTRLTFSHVELVR